MCKKEEGIISGISIVLKLESRYFHFMFSHRTMSQIILFLIYMFLILGWGISDQVKFDWQLAIAMIPSKLLENLTLVKEVL